MIETCRRAPIGICARTICLQGEGLQVGVAMLVGRVVSRKQEKVERSHLNGFN
jgi:hypothetical protein